MDDLNVSDPKFFNFPIEGSVPPADGAKKDNEEKLRDQFLKPNEPDQNEVDVPRAKSIPFGSSSLVSSWDLKGNVDRVKGYNSGWIFSLIGS